MQSNDSHWSTRLTGLSMTMMLVLAACALAAAPTPAPTSTIQGVIWQWVGVTNQPKKETTTVPHPEKYTITFNADHTFTGKADCNNNAGTYSQQNGFKIKLGASTMAFCGEPSLDRQYLQLLGSVAAGGPDGAGGLALETAGGEQRMLFKNGGPAAIDPAIQNQVPKTTTFAAGQCKAALTAPAPAYTSNTIGGVPSGQIAAGSYEVGVAAQYGASLWYGLKNVGSANYINSASVSSTSGDCAVAREDPAPIAAAPSDGLPDRSALHILEM
jgi:heat shock protein HslJ